MVDLDFKSCEERVLWELQQAEERIARYEDELEDRDAEIFNLKNKLEWSKELINSYEDYFRNHCRKGNGYVFIDSELVCDGELKENLESLIDTDEDNKGE